MQLEHWEPGQHETTRRFGTAVTALTGALRRLADPDLATLQHSASRYHHQGQRQDLGLHPLAQTRIMLNPRLTLSAAFFISGTSALVYQLCWNRYLYAAVGVDIDSTSIIVATFMLGLGIGNAFGAYIASRQPGLAAFVWIEIMLFLIGISSPSILLPLSEQLSGMSRGSAAGILFVVLLIPTGLMGATLPVMTEAARGRPALKALNFSALYLFNTLGAAAGAFLCGFVLLGELGLRNSIHLAALANLIAAAAAALTVWTAQKDHQYSQGVES